jgi:hypothetical protein
MKLMSITFGKKHFFHIKNISMPIVMQRIRDAMIQTWVHLISSSMINFEYDPKITDVKSWRTYCYWCSSWWVCKVCNPASFPLLYSSSSHSPLAVLFLIWLIFEELSDNVDYRWVLSFVSFNYRLYR